MSAPRGARPSGMEPVAPARRSEFLLHAALLALATWIAFGPALGAGFVNWDDGENVVQNEAFRGFGGASLRWMFTTTHLGPYQPLSWLTLALDHAVGGLDARVYHRTNLVLHAAGAIALYALARHVLDRCAGASAREPVSVGRRGVSAATGILAEPSVRSFTAFAAALLFAVHPLRVESVAWVTERRDVLSAPFFFLALLAWWRYAEAPVGRGRRYYVLALVALVLSLLAKASAIVMPALLVLIDLGPLRAAARERGARRMVLEKLPVLAIVLPFAWIAAVGQARDSTMLDAATHGLVARAVQAAYSAWFYASRCLWPAGLQPMHRMPSQEALFGVEYVLPALVACAATLAALAGWRKLGCAAWAWFAYLVILSPVSGLAQSGRQLVADRYSYLTCVPLALLAALGCAWIARRGRWLAWSVLLVVAGALAWRANVLTRVWRDSWSLWAHALAVDPDNDTALLDLGVLELETAQGLADPARAKAMLLSAKEHLTRSAQLNREPRRLFNVAAVHVRLADYEPERASEHVATAVATAEEARALARSIGGRIDPRWGMIQAFAYAYAERWADALATAQETLRGTPRDADLRRLAAHALVQLGRAREAIELLDETTGMLPDDALVWLELARAHESAGDAARARAAAEQGKQRLERAFGAQAGARPGYEELARRAGAR